MITPPRFLFFLMVLPIFKVKSQVLQLYLFSGESRSWQVSEIRKITFPDNTFLLHFKDGDSLQWELASIRSYMFDEEAGIVEFPNNPLKFSAFPNPSHHEFTLDYTLRNPGGVRLQITDIQGRTIHRFHTKHTAPGTFRQVWNGTDLLGASVPAGMYFIQLISDLHTSSLHIIKL